jgi:dipeptidyl aminopeptidase/acylaminoacyl peptidase
VLDGLTEKKHCQAREPEIHKFWQECRVLGKDMLLFAVVGLLLSCKDSGAPIEPPLPPNPGKILFTSFRGTTEQLYTINPDASDLRQITSNDYWHFEGRWSPDGKRIVCRTQQVPGIDRDSMVVLTLDDTTRMYLGFGKKLVWDPDGTQVFFIVYPYGSSQWVVDINTRVRRVFSDSITINAISPDRRTAHILWWNFILPNQRMKFVDYPSLTNERELGPPGAGGASWSQNGEEIAFGYRADSTKIGGDIFIMKKDGTNIRRVTYQQPLFSIGDIHWSPDGSKLVFIADRLSGETPRSYLYMVNVDGTDFHRVLDDPTVYPCDWSK